MKYCFQNKKGKIIHADTGYISPKKIYKLAKNKNTQRKMGFKF